MLRSFIMILTLKTPVMNNSIKTINPFNNKTIKEYEVHTFEQLSHFLENSKKTFDKWRETSIRERCRLLDSLAQILEDDKDQLAELITLEMGKPLAQSISEI